MWGKETLVEKTKLPGRDELQTKAAEWQAPQKQPRPFLDAIRQDRLNLQAEINKLERETRDKVTELEKKVSDRRRIEQFCEDHEVTEAIAIYIAEKSND